MEAIFINFTNHPSAVWDQKQLEEARKYGVIQDIPFPNVDPQSSEADIKILGNQYYVKIMSYQPAAVLCQGEFTLAVYVIERLKKAGVTVLSACTKRIVTINGEKKTSVFVFEQFREYI